MSEKFDPPDVDKLVAQLMAEGTPGQKQALLESLMSGRVTSIFEKLNERQEPTVAPIPDKVCGSECAWICRAPSRRSGGA